MKDLEAQLKSTAATSPQAQSKPKSTPTPSQALPAPVMTGTPTCKSPP